MRQPNAERILDRQRCGWQNPAAVPIVQGGQFVTLLDIAKPECAPEAVTFTFGDPVRADAQPFLAAEDILTLQARLKWGSDGMFLEALMDVRRGAKVSLVGNAFRIEVRNRGPANAAEGGLPHNIVIPVIAGYGVTGHMPTLSFVGVNPATGAIAVAAGAAQNQEIPAMANRVRVFPDVTGALGGWLVRQLNRATTVIGEFSVPSRAFGVGPGNELPEYGIPWIPILPEATTIQFANGGTARGRVNYVFELDL